MPTLRQRPSTGTDQTTTAARRKRRPFAPWEIALAVVAALLLQAALIVLLAWALPKWPRAPLKKGTAAAPIQLTIQPAEPTPPGLHKTEPPQPQQPDYIRTPDDRKSETPPPDRNFISDKDTLAQSEKPPEDATKPLPSQDGPKTPTFDFETNPYIAGPEAHDNLSVASPASASAPTPPPVNPTPEPQESPTPPPTARPTPSAEDFLTMRSDSSPSNTPPEPSQTPRSKPTPRPTPDVQDALQRQAEKVRRENRMTSNTSIMQPPGYQPQTTQTKMSGSVDNRGKASVAALGTPLGRYEKAVSDAIGARWYFNVDQSMSTLVRTGEVKIHFVVTRTGKIVNTRVEGRNQNTALADISLEAVVTADLPPIPSDVATILPEGQLEVDYSFSLFEN